MPYTLIPAMYVGNQTTEKTARSLLLTVHGFAIPTFDWNAQERQCVVLSDECLVDKESINENLKNTTHYTLSTIHCFSGVPRFRGVCLFQLLSFLRKNRNTTLL